MSDFTEKVRAMLDAATQGDWINPWDTDDEFEGIRSSNSEVVCAATWHDGCRLEITRKNAAVVVNAPTLLREACERIEALEKVVEAAKDLDSASCLNNKLNAAVRLRNALFTLDAKEQS